jgi:integrase
MASSAAIGRASNGVAALPRSSCGRLPEQLSRAFAAALDAAGVGGDAPPTFHEIRSLGGALLRDAGWTTEQIQALMGHGNASMTEHYLSGHEAPWQPVATGIALPR